MIDHKRDELLYLLGAVDATMMNGSMHQRAHRIVEDLLRAWDERKVAIQGATAEQLDAVEKRSYP